MFRCFRNVSHLAQAQVPSQLANSGDMGNSEMCARCGRAVFFAERIAGMGQVTIVALFHLLWFFHSHKNLCRQQP